MVLFHNTWLLLQSIHMWWTYARVHWRIHLIYSTYNKLCWPFTFPFNTRLLYLAWTTILLHIFTVDTFSTVYTNTSCTSTTPLPFLSWLYYHIDNEYCCVYMHVHTIIFTPVIFCLPTSWFWVVLVLKGWLSSILQLHTPNQYV